MDAVGVLEEGELSRGDVCSPGGRRVRAGGEELLGRLTPGLDHGLDGLAADGVADLVDWVAEVAGGVVAVEGFEGVAAVLLVAEDEVDPGVEVGGGVRGLERLAHDLDE